MIPQHYAVSAVDPPIVSAGRRPVPGPIAMIPVNEVFAEAVHSGGGRLSTISDATRGLIWLRNDGSRQLQATLDQFPAIQWVQLPFAGVDAFAEIFAKGDDDRLPLFTSAKGAYAQPVAEHALTLILALLRVIPQRVTARSWVGGRKIGRSLFGLNVVVVGAGGIAVQLIRLLRPFGVTITVVRRSPSELSGADVTVTTDRLLEFLPLADVVVIAAASTAETRSLFGAQQFAAMKSTSILVNIARGDLVDTGALVDALASGSIEGAGLDVTDPEPLPDGHPLWNEPHALITPHSADTPAMTGPLLATRIRLNVLAFLGDGRFIGVVDPAVGY